LPVTFLSGKAAGCGLMTKGFTKFNSGLILIPL
jgi:hypothetical protein